MKKLALPTLLLVLAIAVPGMAGHDGDPRTRNLHPLGHISEPASLLTGAGGGNIHTDIAFWGRYAFQGSWLGFNIRDIAAPGNPRPVSFTSCSGNQGDVVVWENVLVRSWNSPAGPGAHCDGSPVPQGFEGLHIFDVSDVADPVLVGSVDLSFGAIPGRCGSHTVTAVPDLANDRLLVYSSGGNCNGFDVVEVPLANPAATTYLRTEPADRNCHDISVILGDAMLAACAGQDGVTLWTLTGAGSLADPDFLWSTAVPGVSLGHSTSFSWDGAVLVFGHEPGGGVQAACQAGSPAEFKSLFFLDTGTGGVMGTWTLPRAQSDIENCTLHHFNTVPLRNRRDVLVSGNYQAGTWVVDFTDPTNPVTVAWSDPPPIPPPGGPFCGGLGCEIGGAWSSYWYDGFIYESNITEGLNVFQLGDRAVAGALRTGHSNPQTQEFTIP